MLPDMKDYDQEFLDLLIEKAVGWVRSQRDRHRPGARELTRGEKRRFEGFFTAPILDGAKIKMVPLIENPDFYPDLIERGMTEVMDLDLSQAVGIAYIDTILVSETYFRYSSRWLPLIFHELVHLVQHQVLGLRNFMELYLLGWAQNGFNYSSIPFEDQAHRLQARYESDPRKTFSVESEVRLELR